MRRETEARLTPETLVSPNVGRIAIPSGVPKVKPCLTLEHATPALRLAASLVPWDTESFGVQVAQVQHIEIHDRLDAEAEMPGLLAWFTTQGVDLAACRLDHKRLLESAALERVGFRFIEMVYAMQIDLQSVNLAAEATRQVSWRRACEADIPELRQVAADAFATGRWNMDWSVGQELGGRRYADWVVRSLTNPKHQVLCAVVDDQTAGLFIIEPEPNGSVYWHLTAVVPQWQGKGVGKAMWASMLLGHAVHGARRVHTTISARNVPVVNLYARLGWRFMECQMSYHWASARWLAKGG